MQHALARKSMLEIAAGYEPAAGMMPLLAPVRIRSFLPSNSHTPFKRHRWRQGRGGEGDVGDGDDVHQPSFLMIQDGCCYPSVNTGLRPPPPAADGVDRGVATAVGI